MIKLNNLQSIIDYFETSRENLKNILTEQSCTLFHSFEYYEGQLDMCDKVVTTLKIYHEHQKNKVEG